MVSNVVAHYVGSIMMLMGALVFVFFFVGFVYLFGVITYYAICTFERFYYKWIKRECPHFCIMCKFKRICDYKNTRL